MTDFPLLQTVVTIAPGAAGADAAANVGGGTLSSTSTGDIFADQFQLAVPGAGLNATLSAAGGWWGCYTTVCGYSSTGYAEMNFPAPATSDLSWTTYGTWAHYVPSSPDSFGSFVTGYKTPDASVPMTGSATFTGQTTGMVYFPQEGGFNDTGIGTAVLWGDASLVANFGTGNITGGLTNMQSGYGPWNDVSLTGSITSGVNAFSGSAAVTSAPGGTGALSGTATGSFVGMFFGPGAAELGAVWSLFDGIATATGAIGAKKTP